jgi:hypothetical protein
MAKITITIEDTPQGKVKVVADPTFETMAKMIASGNPVTSAHGYALTMIRAVREESKRQEPTSILIPRVSP